MKKEEELEILMAAKKQLESELKFADLLIIKSLDEIKAAITIIEKDIDLTRIQLKEFGEESCPNYALVNKIERDLYRDTPVRYLGYASEIGESFRPCVPIKWVKISYGISGAYVIADTLDKTRRAWEANQQPFLTAADTLLWQGLATLILPAATVNRTVWAVSKAINASSNRLKLGTLGLFMPTIVGLLTIPFICKPIDEIAEYLMDKSYRKIF